MSDDREQSSLRNHATDWLPPAPQVTNFTRHFWDAACERRLVLQYCTEAQKFQHYPRPVSLYTGRATLEWREVSGAGLIYALTTTRRGPAAFRGREPYLVATIELDEGVRMMSNLRSDADDPAAQIGARVLLSWQPTQGGFNLPIFRMAD